MTRDLQSGIYYRSKPEIGRSFALLLLRIAGESDALAVGSTISRLYKLYEGLEDRHIKNLPANSERNRLGNLSILIGYSQKIFELSGIERKRPSDFLSPFFLEPDKEGGGPVAKGAQLRYGHEVKENSILSDHVAIQFIADNEFYTNRALIETWKEIYKIQQEKSGNVPFYITNFYTGFHSEDGRNWLGFHDGISNMASSERRSAISIDPDYLDQEDRWLSSGTYLAFLRIVIDLPAWQNTKIENQEIIIGRDKETGCPIIGVTKDGIPIKDSRCPVPGTNEVTEPGNEYFRDHPPYGRQMGLLPGISDKSLEWSHVATTRSIDSNPVSNKKSFRIFRQGFEFLENNKNSPNFKVGLNFVSFQNSPERFFESLTYHHPFSNIRDHNASATLNDFLSVHAAGIFIVPPKVSSEIFPGASIFFSS